LDIRKVSSPNALEAQINRITMPHIQITPRFETDKIANATNLKKEIPFDLIDS